MNFSNLIIFVILMAGISSLNPVAVDTFLPAVPAIAQSLSVEASTIGVTLGIFTIGNAIGQITLGPMSDRFGRKPVVVLGLSLFIIAALFAPYCTNIETLSLTRLVQGIGGAAGRILSVAIVRDLYSHEKAARILSNIWTVSTLMPILNPFIGGFLLTYYSWTSVFVYMSSFGIVLILLAMFGFKETIRQIDREALEFKSIVVNIKSIISNRTYIYYTLIGSLSVSSLYAFLSISPDLLITQLQQEPSTYAWQFAIVMCGSMIGSFISSQISVRLGINQIIGIGLAITTVAGSTSFVLAYNGFFSPLTIIMPYFVQRIGENILTPQAMAGAVTPFPEKAGLASSILGCFRQLCGATVAILISYLSDGTPISMATAFFLAGTVPATIFILSSLRNNKHQICNNK